MRMQKWLNRFLKLTAAAAFLAAAFLSGRQAAVLVQSLDVKTTEDIYQEDYSKMQRFCVVVDAGHGGDDPGKVGVNGTLEKELNLAIAKRLAALLRQADVQVVMTRKEDAGLYDTGTSGKKVQDMKRRIALMEETAPDLVVSIHQNSYSDEAIKGAQVFYYTGSEEGQTLAQLIQKRMVSVLDPENHRVEKENDSYYLLKKTSRPIVIVECGFLSNPQEEILLCDPAYQERVAWNIHMGILQYLNRSWLQETRS